MSDDLRRIFPSYDIESRPQGDVPALWRQLLSEPSASALAKIADVAGLPEASNVRSIIARSKSIGELVPKRKRDRGDPRKYHLAVHLGAGLAMIFSHPDGAIGCQTLLPREYRDLVGSLGPCQLTQYSGTIIGQVESTMATERIRSVAESASDSGSFVPFFSYGTGDYDCWRGDAFDEVWTFDHETGRFGLSMAEGFPRWFEIQFQSYVRFP